MIYCFDSRLPWDYSKKEMAISKMNNNGILYDNELKKFMDFDGNIVDIKNKLIFPRTGINHIYNMNNEIVLQGGIPVVSNEQVKVVENWPNYYADKRKSRIVKGYDLVDESTVKEIELCYGKQIFIKTKFKNFSGVISIDLLEDEKCAFYKTLLHHLDDDFIISKKVDILEDDYGKKEYRCFILNNEIYNISRFTTTVLHNIDNKILEEAQKIVKKIKNVFPDYYVLDLFEYQLDGKKCIDVVEFNPINASGLYLYNSCINKSEDILHSNLKKISYEFIDNIDECTIEGEVFNERQNLYNFPNGFSSHLRSICLVGNIGTSFIHGLNFSEKDFARHNPIFNFSLMEEMDDDNSLRQDELNVPEELSKGQVKKLQKLLKENKQ